MPSRALPSRSRTLGAISLVTAATLAAVVPAPGLAAAPDLVTGYRATAPLSSGPAAQIGRLDVGPGRWVAWATLSVLSPSETPVTAVCRLEAPGATDIGRHVAKAGPSPDPFDTGLYRASMELNSAARFDRSGGSFRLECRASGPDASARRIRIMAMRVPDLTVLDSTQTAAEVSADATAVQVRRDGELVLPIHTWQKVLSVDLPPGTWWLHASLTARVRMLVDFEPPECRLQFEGRTSHARGGVVVPGSPQVLAMDLAGVAPRSSRTGGVAVLRCRGDDHAAVANARLTAVRTGRLTLLDVAQDLQTVHGSGTPEVTHVSGTRDGSVAPPNVEPWTDVSTLQVPAGPWLVKSTFRVDGTAPGGLGAQRRMTCRLTDGWDTDTDVISKVDYASRRSLAIVKSGPVKVVRLQCRMPDGGSGEVTAHDLTAFQVGGWKMDPL